MQFIFPEIAFSALPDNANCILKRHSEYTDTFISIHKKAKEELKVNHPQHYDLINTYIDILIIDAKNKQSTVEKRWKINPDALFRRYKYLNELGKGYRKDKALKKKMSAYKSRMKKIKKTGSRASDDAIKALWRELGKDKSSAKKMLNFERIKLSEIKCSDK